MDLIYYGRQGRLENDFEVTAGTNPKVISWRLEGAEGIRVDSTGDLVLTVGGNEVRLQQPRAYQLDGEQQREIPIRYRVHGQKVSFALGKYNRHQKLVIDPVLTYSTYLGGSGGDTAYGVAVDSAGDAYVTGVTASTNFPTTSAGYQTTYAGDGDVFVTEFNPTGTGVVFSTYLGGTGIDTPAQIFLDSLPGNIFLVGSTTSNNFPTTSGGISTDLWRQSGRFPDRDETGRFRFNLLHLHRWYGDRFRHRLGARFRRGTLTWPDPPNSTDFPTMNPLQLGNAGLYDAFVTEVSPTGALVYSTYLGGSSADYGTGIAVDSTGNVYVSGYTYSTNFPTQNALQSSLGGGSDIFITKFTPGSSALLFSTYLGGSSIDQALAMIVDSSGNIYLTGDTQSPNFPVTANAYQSTLAGHRQCLCDQDCPRRIRLGFFHAFRGQRN